MSLLSVPIRRAGNRENLLFGADRELILVVAVMAAALAVASMNLVALIAGVVMWVGCLYLLRLVAKADPKMRWVYLRSLKYRAYYPARSTPFRLNRRDYR